MAEIKGFPVWDDEFKKAHFRQEDIEGSKMYKELICAFIDARQEQGLTQKDLERISGVKQPQIARLEKGDVSPTVANLIKVLAAMGKKLTIESI